jgi:hypothetical protein
MSNTAAAARMAHTRFQAALRNKTYAGRVNAALEAVDLYRIAGDDKSADQVREFVEAVIRDHHNAQDYR